MKVTLMPIDKVEVVDKLYTACRTCYNPGKPEDMFKEIKAEEYQLTSDLIPLALEKRIKLLKHVLDSGHHSVLEHVQFTFMISGVSRSLTHQLVRHRLCSTSQQSQRYCGLEDGVFEYVTPSAIEKNEEAKEVFEYCMQTISEAYRTLTELGIAAEDARAVLPNACCTNLTMSMNIRELIHISNERLCTCAQAEIRTMVRMMVKEVLKQLDFLTPYLVPKCEMLGYCNEPARRSCGRKKLRAEVLGDDKK